MRTLQLVAGDLNRVYPSAGRQELDERALKMAASAAREMTQEAFSDYHLYTLDRKTTVNNNQTKQVSMLDATGFPVIKRYVVDGQSFYYRNAQQPGAPIKDTVQVLLPVQERGQGWPGYPDAGGHRPRLPVGLEGRDPVRRRGSHLSTHHRTRRSS